MVLAREDNGLHAGIDEGLHPLLAIQSGGVEHLGWRIAITPFLVGKGV